MIALTDQGGLLQYFIKTYNQNQKLLENEFQKEQNICERYKLFYEIITNGDIIVTSVIVLGMIIFIYGYVTSAIGMKNKKYIGIGLGIYLVGNLIASL